jgi:K+-transporting ATPase ATPase C chain
MMNPEMQNAKVPVELVTASGSGLDPIFLREGAFIRLKSGKKQKYQFRKTEQLIKNQTETSIFGPSKVNVLKLNIALDQLK